LTLTCPTINDLRDLSRRELSQLAAQLKRSLVAAENCDFRSCRYNLDNAGDIQPVSANTIRLHLKDDEVCRGWERDRPSYRSTASSSDISFQH